MKQCCGCKQEKQQSDFNKNRSQRDGLSLHCRECARRHSRAWVHRNMERVVEAGKRWRASNPERARKRERDWYWRNAEHCRAVARIKVARRKARLARLICDLTTEEWWARLSEFGHLCAYCQEHRATVVDHFWPVTMGGGTTISNVVPSCGPCNQAKYNHNPLVWLEVQAD